MQPPKVNAGRYNLSNATNAFWSLIAPYSGSQAIGSAQIIAADTVVEKLLRRVLNVPNTWTDVGLSHALSMPFRRAVDIPIDTKPNGWPDSFKRAGNSSVSVLIGQFILETFRRGFHFPGANKAAFWNLAVVFAAQGISTPAKEFIFEMMGQLEDDSSVRKAQDIFDQQRAATMLKKE